ncbi:hypothetical protein BB559_004108 [Furculomyces boomerangus]|uniref:Uncharacterized protein n=1 Tax=Furculomyces boomerangus TaxID=61424 RepID=A0A2T9YGM4_9FUNG|nr:hypothetical protein BB559_004108 [Furculomyces boomerangus]
MLMNSKTILLALACISFAGHIVFGQDILVQETEQKKFKPDDIIGKKCEPGSFPKCYKEYDRRVISCTEGKWKLSHCTYDRVCVTCDHTRNLQIQSPVDKDHDYVTLSTTEHAYCITPGEESIIENHIKHVQNVEKNNSRNLSVYELIVNSEYYKKNQADTQSNMKKRENKNLSNGKDTNNRSKNGNTEPKEKSKLKVLYEGYEDCNLEGDVKLSETHRSEYKRCMFGKWIPGECVNGDHYDEDQYDILPMPPYVFINKVECLPHELPLVYEENDGKSKRGNVKLSESYTGPYLKYPDYICNHTSHCSFLETRYNGALSGTFTVCHDEPFCYVYDSPTQENLDKIVKAGQHYNTTDPGENYSWFLIEMQKIANSEPGQTKYDTKNNSGTKMKTCLYVVAIVFIFIF